MGSVETSLLNITSAYATFVNGGKKIKPILINRIQDRRGKTIFSLTLLNVKVVTDIRKITMKRISKINLNSKQVISEQTAYQITSILKGVIERGTGKKLKDLNVPIAGKTGTTKQ